jgi:hypothetical protein
MTADKPRGARFGGVESVFPFRPEPMAAMKARFPGALKKTTNGDPAHVFDCDDGLRLIASRDFPGQVVVSVWILDGGVFDESWRGQDTRKAVEAMKARAAELAGVEKSALGHCVQVPGEPAIGVSIPNYQEAP